ncbi:nucleotidyltransferase family protein [Nannocystis bainbridge]|uniref:Nucleotidyltransferase family protein n=1 Tax=Nannocystis bainbridge TaxID=2995303 RepID=A0ABT5E919_9BACT|nr:nucleotidyltransferase family protein [Nannocystis bainbridge]MDC0722354.1 nucleotidyltransferase family protein [Nannocystis bainbridge]
MTDLVDPHARAFYVRTMIALTNAEVPFMVGGAYAFARYTSIERHTKDLDIFVLPEDAERTLEVLAAEGFACDMAYPHWLGKCHCGEDFVDVIFSSGNAVARVDEQWFAHAPRDMVLGQSVLLVPPEEMVWSKAFIMERERFDGADVAHVLRSCADQLDWDRLVERFGEHFRVLLSHLILFGFIYPGEQSKIPDRVMRDMLDRLRRDGYDQTSVCKGTLLSRQQYLTDIDLWDLADARLEEHWMSREDIAHWTAAIDKHGR